MPEPGRAFWLTGGGAAVGLLSFLAVRSVGKRLFGPGAMGMGDVKLAMLLGAMVGLQWVAAVLLLGVLLAGTAATVLLMTRRADCSQHLAYGFYLSIAGLVILLLTTSG
jgi:leader peptidase (prepilin peptidase)/N-methyltransferase